jgi:hypothetical protein
MRGANTCLVILGWILCVVGTACTSLSSGEGARVTETVTVDGLQLVVDERQRKIFVKPGADLTKFSRFLIDPVMVSYSNSTDAGTTTPVRTLDPEIEERLVSLLQSGLAKEVERRGKLEVSEEPGPEVVRVQGWLYDVIVGKPAADDRRNAPVCFARMAVILTVRHSQTAQALARVVHRARFSCSDNSTRTYQTARWSDVEAGIEPWTKMLANSLEELGDLSLDSSPQTP